MFQGHVSYMTSFYDDVILGDDVTNAYLQTFWLGQSGLCFVRLLYKQDFKYGAKPSQKILPLKTLHFYPFMSMVLNFRLARLSSVVKIAKINRNFLQNTTKCRSILGSIAYNFTNESFGTPSWKFLRMRKKTKKCKIQPGAGSGPQARVGKLKIIISDHFKSTLLNL